MIGCDIRVVRILQIIFGSNQTRYTSDETPLFNLAQITK
jgi:hypothetical protein